MRPRTRYRALPDAAYDPRLTDLSRPLNAPLGAGVDSSGQFTPGDPGAVAAAIGSRRYFNKNVSQMIGVQLVAGVSLRVLPFNDRRSGLQINNLDATAALSYSFGNDLQTLGIQLAAGAMALYDFTTPADTLYLFSTANIFVVVLEVSRKD